MIHIQTPVFSTNEKALLCKVCAHTCLYFYLLVGFNLPATFHKMNHPGMDGKLFTTRRLVKRLVCQAFLSGNARITSSSSLNDWWWHVYKDTQKWSVGKFSHKSQTHLMSLHVHIFSPYLPAITPTQNQPLRLPMVTWWWLIELNWLMINQTELPFIMDEKTKQKQLLTFTRWLIEIPMLWFVLFCSFFLRHMQSKKPTEPELSPEYVASF